MAGAMKWLSEEELKKALAQRREGERLLFRERELEPSDLTGWDLSNIDFTLSSFQGSTLNQVNFSGSSLENALFDRCSLKDADFQNANLKTASFRYCDLRNSNIKGANLFGAILEYADLTGIRSDADTQWFRMRCPETGAFLGYKKCFNDRLVQLLIPADAKRTSATLPSCRCSRATISLWVPIVPRRPMPWVGKRLSPISIPRTATGTWPCDRIAVFWILAVDRPGP